MKSNRHRILAAAGIALATAAGVFGTTRYREVDTRRRQLASLEGRLVASDAAADRYRRAAKEVPGLRAEHRRFVEQAPYQPDLGVLLERVGQDLQGPEAEREVVTQPVVEGRHLNRTPILLRFRAPAGRVFSVLQHMENPGLLTRVERVRMEQATPGTDGPLSVSVEFSLFSRASEEALSCKITE